MTQAIVNAGIPVHSNPGRQPQPSVTVRRRVRPRPAVDLTRMTRYRGGTYSATVDTIAFVDGSTARTDLIRLNPGVDAYSLDFTGRAPTQPSHYRMDTWSAVPNLRAHAYEAEVDWILRNSFPRLSAAELSRRLRAAGYPLGAANISEHEAIAGTQAAIWRFTNSLELDSRPLDLPVSVTHGPDGVTVEFDGERELGGYEVDIVGGAAEAEVRLHRSADGQDWQPVDGSRLDIDAGTGTYGKGLGVGATVSGTGRGGGHVGYRHYRLAVSGTATIADVRFFLNGSSNFRNPARIVHLYDYLLAGAARARARTTGPRLTAANARVQNGLVGPFRLAATDRVALEGSDVTLVDNIVGAPITGPVEPGAGFYLRVEPGTTSATVTMTVPGDPDGYGGRVIAGVARDESSSRYTPLALAVPADLVVDFDIDWSY
jgi:TQXA domain-containing protein